MTEKSSRRSVLKGVAATGTAATGLAAFGGQAAGQTTNVNANPLFGSGLIVVQGVNVLNISDITVQDVTVTILENVDVDINVEDVQVLNDNVIKILNDVSVENVLNQNQVTVQVSLLGSIIGSDTVNVPGNLRA